MNENQRKSHIQLEINDLIEDAVNNAIARRNQDTNTGEGLSALSDEEVKSIMGGGLTRITPIVTLGIIALPKKPISTIV